MSFETTPFGVHTVVIQPGGVATEWGKIAAENLRATSKKSAYRNNADLVADVLEYTKGAEPEVIARAVSKAVNARKPSRRY